MGYHRKMRNSPYIGEIVSERAHRIGKCVVLSLSKHGKGYLLRTVDGSVSFIATATDFKRFSPQVRARVQQKHIEKYGLKIQCSRCGTEFVPRIPSQFVDAECLSCLFGD